MKLKPFKTELTRVILEQRDRCAKVAEKFECPLAVEGIRKANWPYIRIDSRGKIDYSVFCDSVVAAINAERKRCLGICQKFACVPAAAEIASWPEPKFRVVYPMTIDRHPELIGKQDLIVAKMRAAQVAAGERMVYLAS